MPVLSTIPAAIGFLISQFQNSPLLGKASPSVDVVNGPGAYVEGNIVPGATSSNQVLWVGYSTNPLVDAGVEMKSQIASLGGQRDREQYTIHCCAAYLNNDDTIGNMDATQAVAMSMYAAAREIITLNRNLGGLQGIAQINQGTVTSKQTSYGPRVDVEFDVDVDAFQTYSP